MITHHPGAESALEVFQACSNAGKWGSADQAGTLNYITDACRVAAAGQVQQGISVSLSREISTTQSSANPRPAWHVMHLPNHDYSANDSVHLQIHGHSTTHIDALGHMFFDGRGYNDRRQADVVQPTGLTSLDVTAYAQGIFTRAVLLDVAAAAGVDWLDVQERIGPDLLEAAERAAGVQIQSGDAIFVHTGLERRESEHGPQDPNRRCGVTLEAVRWMHSKQISLYAGDCIEALPLDGSAAIEMPLHQIGLAAMGLALLDCAQLTPLLQTCAELSRSTFLLVVAPLLIPGATGSPTNPLALF